MGAMGVCRAHSKLRGCGSSTSAVVTCSPFARRFTPPAAAHWLALRVASAASNRSRRRAARSAGPAATFSPTAESPSASPSAAPASARRPGERSGHVHADAAATPAQHSPCDADVRESYTGACHWTHHLHRRVRPSCSSPSGTLTRAWRCPSAGVIRYTHGVRCERHIASAGRRNHRDAVRSDSSAGGDRRSRVAHTTRHAPVEASSVTGLRRRFSRLSRCGRAVSSINPHDVVPVCHSALEVGLAGRVQWLLREPM